MIWCSNTDTRLGALDRGIGTGMSNTTELAETCNSGAIHWAFNYDINGKSDWFLPSFDELNELCKFARQLRNLDGCYQGGLLRGYFSRTANIYWSSSEYSDRGIYMYSEESATHAMYISFEYPNYGAPVSGFKRKKSDMAYVLLVRAF